jgi:hypothetical protein
LIWSVFEKVAQAKARFNAMDKLVVVLHSVRIPVGFGRAPRMTRSRQLANMAHLKPMIIEVKAENNGLVHDLIIAISSLNIDPNYESYRKGYKIRPVFESVLETTGINLANGGGIPELIIFQDHFLEYVIEVYECLH